MESTTWLRQLERGRDALGDLLERPADADEWLEEAEKTLAVVSAALAGFDSAVRTGYYDDVVAHAPRLVPVVDRLRVSHDELRITVEAGYQRLRDDEVDVAVVDLRRELSDVVIRLDLCTHRQVGLMYEAYDVDIGGPGA